MQAATPTRAPSPADQPMRLLLVRSRPGELPWLATAIAKTMAPVEIVEVIGFANAIWRLGNELFDTVLLDVEIPDPAAMAYFREQIADVGAVPVLDLREPAEAEQPAPHALRLTPPSLPAGRPKARPCAGACACPGNGGRGDRRSSPQSLSQYPPPAEPSRAGSDLMLL